MDDALRSLPIPGLRWGDYPQRSEAAADAAGARRGLLRARELPPRAAAIQARARGWRALPQPAFDGLRGEIQARIARRGLTPAMIDAAAAWVVEAARRTLGRAAYDGQVMAAIAMADNGLVEMATGEGKSLATALAATIGGLAAIPVHVLTANDYLVSRDAAAFAPLFAGAGLTVAAVTAASTEAERRRAYASSLVYATAREIAFDYLRDRLRHGPGDALLARRLRALRADGGEDGPLLRGLCMAIVDEADSVLIDEAMMPLVLSRPVDDPAALAWLLQAWLLSSRLESGRDFRVLEERRSAELTPAGREALERLARPLAAVWKNRLHREQAVGTALAARHALVRDRDYLVRAADEAAPARVELIDTVTGRVAVGRRWSAGLHALVAIKEGLAPEPDLETVDRITFQRFFRRYHRLGGSSGTLAEARAELRRIYGLTILPVPARLPSRRRRGPTRCFTAEAARDRAIITRVAGLAAAGRPVLIGTDSVVDTRRIAGALTAAGLGPAVLDARFDAEEAAIVARAGEAGRVTVATSMAGRGTDIVLTPQARACGGLHVLLCQRNASRRHDRQLAGRAGRQGDPGSAETWLLLRRGSGTGRGGEIRLPSLLLDGFHVLFQWLQEGRLARRRVRMLREDRALDGGLSFCGPH